LDNAGGFEHELGIVSFANLCQFRRMEVTVTKPIEEFIERQLAKGYSDANEVTRQAFLRWMEEEDFVADPPQLQEKLDAARKGKFHRYHPKAYDALLASADETAR
jgi:Arc/MetJ-type ribon-helix-helix transcriptional regulator